jgi:hypothetical protein
LEEIHLLAYDGFKEIATLEAGEDAALRAAHVDDNG